LRCVDHIASCRIDFLSARLSTTYEYADLQAELAGANDVVFSVSDADLAWAAAEPPNASKFELHLSDTASEAAWTALMDSDLQGFRVSCDDQELFVGLTYLQYGAAAMMVPVLHIEQVMTGTVVFRLGAWQGAWLLTGGARNETERARIDRPELRVALCARGILNELPTEP
jgi:hypothetical protein